MQFDVDKVDINILFYLYKNKKTDALYSAKIPTIVKDFNSTVSYYTVVRRVQKLIEKGYAEEGFKSSNAKTYYLSQKGIDFLNENVINKNSIYNEVCVDEYEENSKDLIEEDE